MARAADLAKLAPIAMGGLEIRPATREIVSPAGCEVIEPRVMQVLLALIAANGEVVSRDALVRDCWDDRAVSEDAINRVIQRLRRLSESLGAGAFVIKTIHKIGYRLIVPASDVSANESDVAKKNGPGLSRRVWLVGATAAVVTGGTGLWFARRDPQSDRAGALIAEADQALRSGMPDTDARAAGLLEHAARLSPGNALAWGRLALARTYMAQFAPPARAATTVAGVQDAARRALAIDPRQADAHAALAILPPYFGDWLAAERRMKRVLAIAPDHLPTRDALNFMHTNTGRLREGCEDRVRMAALDPFHATYQFKLIYAHWLLGQLNEADRAADRASQLWPRHPGVWSARFNIYALAGRPERAIEHVDNLGARPELPPFMIQLFRGAAVALASRRPADRDAAGDALMQAATRNPAAAVHAVTLLNGLGETDRAFAVAEAYLLERGPLMASVGWQGDDMALRDERRRNTIMLFIPSSAGMRADPRFARLVEDVGLVGYWRSVGVTPDYLV